MTREEAIKEIEKVFEPAFANYIVEALTKGATISEQEPTTKNDLPHCQHTDEEIAKSFIEDVEAVKDQIPCGNQMDFPDTFDEFAKDYGFKDKDEVYTNGSELIPVFRVKQWLEHISTTKNDLAVDCISRKQAIETIQRYGVGCFDADEFSSEECERFVIGKLNELPSVTPQEPRKGKWIYKEFDERTGMTNVHICSKCGCPLASPYKSFCSNCGSDNREVEK